MRAYLALSLTTALAGCTASGYPQFVKFSPDNRWIVYEDARYARAYAYDLQAKQKYPFTGRVACLDRDVKHLVLLPDRYCGDRPAPDPVPSWLITLDQAPPDKQPLPPLPTGSGLPRPAASRLTV